MKRGTDSKICLVDLSDENPFAENNSRLPSFPQAAINTSLELECDFMIKYSYYYRLLPPKVQEAFQLFIKNPIDLPDDTDPLSHARSMEKNDLRTAFNERIKQVYGFDLIVGRKRPSGLIPDTVVIDSNGCPVVMIEYEAPDVKIKAGDHLEKVSSYAVDYLIETPKLAVLTIIITNGWEFVCGHLHRYNHAGFEISLIKETFTLYDNSGILDLNGFKLFHAFMVTNKDQYLIDKFITITGKIYEVGKLIGVGGSSCIYECANDDLEMPAVIKFHQQHEVFDVEAGMYKKFSDLNIGPRFIDCVSLRLVLQRGTPFIPATFSNEKPTISIDHFEKLFEQLLVMHQNGYVHRDLRLTNFLLLENGTKAVLNDFGSCARIGSKAFYNGSRETASQRILSIMTNAKDQSGVVLKFYPEDDYESFFKAFMIWKYNLASRLYREDSYPKFFSFWINILETYFGDEFPLTSEDWQNVIRSRVLCKWNKNIESWNFTDLDAMRQCFSQPQSPNDC